MHYGLFIIGETFQLDPDTLPSPTAMAAALLRESFATDGLRRRGFRRPPPRPSGVHLWMRLDAMMPAVNETPAEWSDLYLTGSQVVGEETWYATENYPDLVPEYRGSVAALRSGRAMFGERRRLERWPGDVSTFLAPLDKTLLASIAAQRIQLANLSDGVGLRHFRPDRPPARLGQVLGFSKLTSLSRPPGASAVHLHLRVEYVDLDRFAEALHALLSDGLGGATGEPLSKPCF